MKSLDEIIKVQSRNEYQRDNFDKFLNEIKFS